MHILTYISHAFAYRYRRLSSACRPRKTKAPQLMPQRTYSLPPLTPLPLRTAIAGCLPRAARAKQKRRSSRRNAHTHLHLSRLCVPLPPAVFSAARAKQKRRSSRRNAPFSYAVLALRPPPRASLATDPSDAACAHAHRAARSDGGCCTAVAHRALRPRTSAPPGESRPPRTSAHVSH